MAESVRSRSRAPDDRTIDRGARLLEDFHSRRLRAVRWISERVGARTRFPRHMRPFGRGIHICYDSDKKDPGDDRDRVGAWKPFIHHHDTEVILWQRAAEHGPDAEAVAWGDLLIFLGYCPEFAYKDARGRKTTRRYRAPLPELWATPDRKCLVLTGRGADTVLWTGRKLIITWRGIEG